ncbi:tripartite tricarboxylate transporter TctB family protein [Agromyces sp. NPDC058484]|uniref:tripartite tricarboxylate transporter TctB family protein n=1 Tax=Agromyces sp. NPDC058484 TaxID=3346524 RepID=UPI00366331D9
MAAENLKRRPKDVVAGAVVGVLGVAYTIVALQTQPDPSSASVIGPAVFPTLLGILLVAGGAALALTGLRFRPATADETEPPTRDGRRLWITLAMLAAYVVAFIPVGYLLSTAAFLMGVTSYFSPRSWKSNIVYAVVFPVIVLVVFEYLLRVPLPEGLLAGVLP